jgi:ABC-type branched-chain amino acid transport systems, ATPase component
MSTAESLPAVSLAGVDVGYHGVPIVSGIDLTVSAGEVVALFGPNGAGKTTLLQAIAGEIPTLGGRLSVLGDASARPLFRRARAGLGLLSDDRSVFSGLTARDNLRLGRGSVERALEFFPELEPHLGRRTGLLSGGQQQMLALARILAAEPKVILADELSLGLAPMIVARLLTALREAAERGAAVLIVEQHVQVALKAVDRAYVLAQGRIVLSDTAESLRADPDRIADLYFGAA